MLKRLGVLAAFLIASFSNAAPSICVAETGKSGDTLVGASARKGPVHIRHILEETKDLEFMYAFNVSGTMTESSNYDAAPPVPPAYGVWKKVESETCLRGEISILSVKGCDNVR